MIDPLAEIEVPREMLDADYQAWNMIAGGKERAYWDRKEMIARYTAALQWLDGILSEQDPDFHRAILKREKERYPDNISQQVAFEFGVSFARQYVSGLFHAPEPEMPEEIPHHWNVRRHDNGAIEVCRGDHEKSEGCEWEPWDRAPKAEAPYPLDDLYIFQNQFIPVDLKVDISAADVNVRINEAYNRGKKAAKCSGT